MLQIINRSTNPYFNLALEEYLLKNIDADIFMLWQNRPAVIVGRNQNTWDEIDVDFVKEQKVAVVRRLTGGGAVYHDLGNLNFTFISRRRRGTGLDFAGFALPIVETLQQLGLGAEFGGRNDIALEGRKVSGNAQYIFPGGVLHHGTLLFDTDLPRMVQALNVSPDKIASKGVASVRSRVTNIKEHLASAITMDEFKQALVAVVSELYARSDLQEYCLTQDDCLEIDELVRSKYGTREWNYGTSPRYDVQKMRRFSWGKLDVHLNVREGLIADCRIYGDFFGTEEISCLEAALCNIPYREDEIKKALEKVDLTVYIYGLERDALVDLLVG